MQPLDRPQTPTTTDVLVVGAGPAGLAAALTARRAGASVRIVERRLRAGGRSRTDTVAGAQLNLGPHALYRDGAAERFLTDVGVELSGAEPPVDAGRIVDERGAHRLPAGALGLLRTTGIPHRAKPSVAMLLARLDRLAASAPPDRSAADVIAEVVSDPAALRLADTLVRLVTYAPDPARISADAAIPQLAAGLSTGVRYLDGGWQRWVDDLVEIVVAAGVTVEFGAGVSAVRASGDGAVSVEIGDRMLDAGTVVLAVGPDATRRLLGDDALFPALSPPSVASCLDLVVRAGAVTHTIALGLDRPLYGSRHDPPASGLAPAGTELVSLLRYASGEETIDRGVADELEAFARWLGVSSADVIERRHLHRVVTAEAVPHPSTGGLAGRPPIEVAGHAGVFVAGDWVGGEGLLVDAAVSSAVAAGAAAAAQAPRGVSAAVGG